MWGKSMSKAKIYYFTLQDEQTKEEKLEWFEQTRLEQVSFEHVTPDRKHNWVNLTDNDFDEFLPLIDKQVKAGKSEEAVFQLFSRGVATQRDEWVYDFSKEALIERMKYFVEVYQERLKDGTRRKLDIKWDPDLERCLEQKIQQFFEEKNIVKSCYRPYAKQYLYFDKDFNGRTYQLPSIFPSAKKPNKAIWIKSGIDAPCFHWVVEHIPDVLTNGGSQCLPLYRYDENGDRIDNITDWALEQFRQHYGSPCPADIPLGKGDSSTAPLGKGGSRGDPHAQAQSHQSVELSDTLRSPCPADIPLGKGDSSTAPLDKGGSRGDPHAQAQSHQSVELSDTLRSPCPSGIPLGKGDSSAAHLAKGGSRGDQIDYAAIARQRNLTYKKGHLPYNPQLVDRAKSLRKDMTRAERKLWYDFLKTFPERVLRQRPIDHFIIDFYCPALNLVIEVDGGQHYSEEGQETDAERTAILESYGLQVLRFRNDEVLQEFENVCQVIEGMRSPCPTGIPLGKGDSNSAPLDKEDSSTAPLDKGGSRGDLHAQAQSNPSAELSNTLGESPCPAGIPLGKGDSNSAPLDKEDSSTAPLDKGGSRGDPITKLDIFHYTYAVLHHPAYRTKYELNLKREFPRLPYYPNFHQWATWGKTLMDLHLTYETADPYGLERVDVGADSRAPQQTSLIPDDVPTKPKKPPKPKLKADKTQGHIILDTDTTLTGVPAVAWDYKLGNRSALEWILDQYKEKKPKDPTIRELFNTYRFADYKDHVIDLLQRVCTVSVETMHIIHQMPDTVEHQGEA